MKLIEMIVSVCILVLVLAAAGSLIAGIGDTTVKTIALRKQLYEQQQSQIELREASNADIHP